MNERTTVWALNWYVEIHQTMKKRFILIIIVISSTLACKANSRKKTVTLECWRDGAAVDVVVVSGAASAIPDHFSIQMIKYEMK